MSELLPLEQIELYKLLHEVEDDEKQARRIASDVENVLFPTAAPWNLDELLFRGIDLTTRFLEIALLRDGGEANYAGYRRVVISRSSDYWEVDGDTVTNKMPITFPMCAGQPCTITGFAIYSQDNGAEWYRYIFPFPFHISSGVTPQFTPGNLSVTET